MRDLGVKVVQDGTHETFVVCCVGSSAVLNTAQPLWCSP
jgi:hypothetical protein